MADRHAIEWMNEQVVAFRDDDREGWKMLLTRGNDGDFWIGIVPDYRDVPDVDERAAMRCGGIRVRMPLLGGGSHESLYHALATFWNQIEQDRLRTLPTEETLLTDLEG